MMLDIYIYIFFWGGGGKEQRKLMVKHLFVCKMEGRKAFARHHMSNDGMNFVLNNIIAFPMMNIENSHSQSLHTC
jgi:hypothetical protein